MARVLLALALLAATIGGCTPCNVPVRKADSGRCCSPAGRCERPSPARSDHKDCAAQLVNMSRAASASPVPSDLGSPRMVSEILASVTLPETAESFARVSSTASGGCSPPCLYLLNSAIRI